MSRGLDLKGKSFGKLVPKSRTENKKNGYFLWNCDCACGGSIVASTKELQRGTIWNCGCIPKNSAKNGNKAENLKGRIFGELEVLERAENLRGRTRWLCRCSCGKEKIITSHELKAGKTITCGEGYHKKGRSYSNIKNRRFDRLVALYPTDYRDSKGSVIWHCVCDCGKECDVSQDLLVFEKKKSCGCLLGEVYSNINNTLHRVDGTCVEHLAGNRKIRGDNTSGHTGIYSLKDGKFSVYIGFKKKKYYLGRYKNFEEAVVVREEAEELVHEGFIEAWGKWNTMDEEWKKENPLVFDVFKENGKLLVYTNITR